MEKLKIAISQKNSKIWKMLVGDGKWSECIELLFYV